MPNALYNRTSVSIVVAFLGSLYGCNVVNPPERTPTYVRIDSFHFQGKELHGISCAWVYYNNNPIGVFDLPATIPIMATGSGKLQIAPGITINGRNELLTVYPFYTIDTSVLEEGPDRVVMYLPQTRYYSKSRVRVISDFEAGLTGFARSTGRVGMQCVTEDSLRYEGTGSGAVFLKNGDETSTDSTIEAFPVEHGPAFIEITYKSSALVSLGLQAYVGNSYQTSVVYSAGIKPSQEWRKFYFNVTEFTQANAIGKCKLFIKTSLPEGQASGKLLIDNIRLITF